MKGPFDVWVMYLRLKLHFKCQAEYFDYSIIPNFTRDAYLNRRDRRFFERIWDKYGKDSHRFMLSCFVGLKVTPGDMYVHTMLDDPHYEKMWTRYQSVEDSLINQFRKDLTQLIRKDKSKSLKNAIRKDDKRLPFLLRRVLTYDFAIESYVILNSVLPVNDLYSRDYEMDPRVSRVCRTAERYAPFIRISESLVKQTLKEICALEQN